MFMIKQYSNIKAHTRTTISTIFQSRQWSATQSLHGPASYMCWQVYKKAASCVIKLWYNKLIQLIQHQTRIHWNYIMKNIYKAGMQIINWNRLKHTYYTDQWAKIVNGDVSTGKIFFKLVSGIGYCNWLMTEKDQL